MRSKAEKTKDLIRPESSSSTSPPSSSSPPFVFLGCSLLDLDGDFNVNEDDEELETWTWLAKETRFGGGGFLVAVAGVVPPPTPPAVASVSLAVSEDPPAPPSPFAILAPLRGEHCWTGASTSKKAERGTRELGESSHMVPFLFFNLLETPSSFLGESEKIKGKSSFFSCFFPLLFFLFKKLRHPAFRRSLPSFSSRYEQPLPFFSFRFARAEPRARPRRSRILSSSSAVGSSAPGLRIASD